MNGWMKRMRSFAFPSPIGKSIAQAFSTTIIAIRAPDSFSSHYLLAECSCVSLTKQKESYLVSWMPLWTCGCTPSYVYEITDVSKYQNSMFAMQETDTLPDPTCDWSLLDQPTLPEPEANHFTSGGKEYMFVRNLFETRRMQYTLYNAIGDNPQTWQNGKPVTRADGSPLVTVKLSIPESVAANSFWPWRSDQIVELFNSCPPGEYAFEAWDVYCDGAFQYTEYYISVK